MNAVAKSGAEMSEPRDLSIVDAARLIADGSLRPSELLESCLERIHERDDVVHAWQYVDLENGRRQARALDDTTPVSALHGIPLAVKDVIDVADMPTGCGSLARANRMASKDSWIVERLRSAGAVVVGKTATAEFALFTPSAARNPRDLERTPGGSSSGSAAAVADHMVPLALGTQTAGSTSRPASFCGTAALVVTRGHYEMDGISPISHSLDTLGVFTRTVADLSLVWQALEKLPRLPPEPPQAPRLLVCSGAAFGPVEPGMRDAFERAVESLRRAGCSIRRFVPSDSQATLPATHDVIMHFEAARSLADEREYGSLSEPLLALLDRGAAIPDEMYQAALAHAIREKATVLEQLRDVDALLAPGALGVAPQGIEATGNPAMSRPWQALGLPAVTVPGLSSPDGLPLGVQLVGRPNDELRILTAAAYVESCLR